MSCYSDKLRCVLGLVLMIGLVSSGCGGEEEAALGANAVSCQADADCAVGEWCQIELTLASDLSEGTCEPLEGFVPETESNDDVQDPQNQPEEMSRTCLSDVECPRGFECDGGLCVEEGTSTSNDSNNQNPSLSNTTTPGPGVNACDQDQDCSPESECCEGSCVMRGSCGGSSTPTDMCGGDSDCEVDQECCPSGVCQSRGSCGGSSGSGGSGSGSAICTQACNQMLRCTDQICSTTILDVTVCEQVCNEDPTAFGAESVVAASCTELNGVFCDDPEFPVTLCDCGGSSGGSSDDICQEFGWYGDGTCDSFCPQPDPDCGGSSTGTCGDIFTCFDGCPDPDTDNICAQGCYDAASFLGQLAYDSLGLCYQTWCDGLMDSALDTCLSTNCQSEINACFSQ